VGYKNSVNRDQKGEFTYSLLFDLVDLLANMQTASYTLHTSLLHLKGILLGSIGTYGDCNAAPSLNALLGGGTHKGVIEESPSTDAAAVIPTACGVGAACIVGLVFGAEIGL